MSLLVGLLAIAALGILAPRVFSPAPAVDHRPRLAGPDDQGLDFAAALRSGPLPRYIDERDELEVRRCR